MITSSEFIPVKSEGNFTIEQLAAIFSACSYWDVDPSNITADGAFWYIWDRACRQFRINPEDYTGIAANAYEYGNYIQGTILNSNREVAPEILTALENRGWITRRDPQGMIYLPYEPKYYSANGGFETIESTSLDRMIFEVENAIAAKLGADTVNVKAWSGMNGSRFTVEINVDFVKPAPAQDSGIITLEPPKVRILHEVETMDAGTVIARLTDD